MFSHWVAISVKLPQDPRFIKAGHLAWSLFVAGECYGWLQETDGFVPFKIMRTLVPGLTPKRSDDCAARLVDANIWQQVNGGFRSLEHLQHNLPAAERRRRREDQTKRMRDLRARRSDRDGARAGSRAQPPTPDYYDAEDLRTSRSGVGGSARAGAQESATSRDPESRALTIGPRDVPPEVRKPLARVDRPQLPTDIHPEGPGQARREDAPAIAQLWSGSGSKPRQMSGGTPRPAGDIVAELLPDDDVREGIA